MRTMEELVEEVRSLPVVDRLRLVEQIVHEIADASAGKREVPPHHPNISPVGWLADDPDLADQLEKLTADARARGRASVSGAGGADSLRSHRWVLLCARSLYRERRHEKGMP